MKWDRGTGRARLLPSRFEEKDSGTVGQWDSGTGGQGDRGTGGQGDRGTAGLTKLNTATRKF